MNPELIISTFSVAVELTFRKFDFIYYCYIIVKEGSPSNEELETLSQKIGEGWKPLGRRLNMNDSKLIAFHKENEEYTEKPYKMLLFWKQRESSAATYQVLYEALCHRLVNRRDLAEDICGYK